MSDVVCKLCGKSWRAGVDDEVQAYFRRITEENPCLGEGACGPLDSDALPSLRDARTGGPLGSGPCANCQVVDFLSDEYVGAVRRTTCTCAPAPEREIEP